MILLPGSQDVRTTKDCGIHMRMVAMEFLDVLLVPRLDSIIFFLNISVWELPGANDVLRPCSRLCRIHDECRFKPMKVKEIIQEVLNEKLEGQKYHVDKVLVSECTIIV
jgi:hypothetical protein